jgi:hypothetical protein
MPKPDQPFPFQVNRVGREDVQIVLPNGTEVLLCAHGAGELARMLTEAAKGLYCDGYRHGDESTMHIGTRNSDDPPFRSTHLIREPAIVYTTNWGKPSAKLRPSAAPRGLDDLATDLP